MNTVDLRLLPSTLENLHIFAGLIASVFCLVPLFVKKGGKNHILYGRIVICLMMFVAISAFILAAGKIIFFHLEPGRKFYKLFQCYLGIFLISGVQQGIKAIRTKQPDIKTAHWSAIGWPILLMMSSLCLLFLGFILKRPIFSVFALFGNLFSIYQLRYWLVKRKKTDWLRFHLSNLIISSALCLTALNLEVVSRIIKIPVEKLSVWIWLFPCFLLIPLIYIFNKKMISRIDPEAKINPTATPKHRLK